MDTNETKIYIALLIAAGILSVFLIFFILTIIGHQRRHQILQKEKTNAEITTLEKERARIASDLHDDLGPVLSAVKLLINNVDLKSAEDTETLAKATHYIDTILAQLRTISNNLMPQALIRKGLLVAVEEFVSERPQKSKMRICFRFDERIQLAPAESIHLYRIILEIIHNAEKHAEATELKISLQADANKLMLELKDNGKGFDSRDSSVTQKGLGLKNILSRVDTLKGNMYLNSSPKKGTEYLIEIPLTEST
jgi:signal transduction histidine kinase